MAKLKMPMPDRKILSGHISKSIPMCSTSPADGKIIIFDSWCKKCGICSHFCPTGALEVNEEGYPYLANPDKCTLCGMCWMRCPDLAIIKGLDNGKEKDDKKSVPVCETEQPEKSEGGEK